MEGNENNIRWYVMQVMSGHEARVFKQLCFECCQDSANADVIPEKDAMNAKFNGLVYGIYELDIPFEVVKGKRDASTGKVGKDVKRKLYPGYILLRAALRNEDGWLIDNLNYIRNVKSVIGLIGGMYPVPLADDEAARMMNSQANDGMAKPMVQYQVGETVIIKEDSFAGCEGIIESIDEERQKLKLSVAIFGRYTPVELDCGQVERP